MQRHDLQSALCCGVGEREGRVKNNRNANPPELTATVNSEFSGDGQEG